MMQPEFPAVAAQAGGDHSPSQELAGPSGIPDEANPLPAQGDSDVCLAQILHRLRAAIGQRNFRHWFVDRTSVRLKGDDTLQVGVAGSFFLTWMQRQFAATVLEAARRVIPQATVEWHVAAQSGVLPLCEAETRADSETDETDPETTGNAKTDAPIDGVSPESPVHSALSSPRRETASCSPSATDRTAGSQEARRFRDLAEFVCGPCNELALTAARQVSEQPGERYSPLFLHGGVGTGKTHLAEGIYRQVRRLHPERRTVFMTSEQFTNQFTSALRSHTLPAFRQRFRSVDVLIVDDVGFLGGKRVIQEEFLHTFKQLESHGRQLVVTCDTHPRLMSGATEELVSRFLCGLVCRLENPDARTRRKIVQSRAEILDVEFDEAALDDISRRFVNSVRELEGALNTLETWHAMTGRRVTLNAARKVLAELERDCIRVVRLPEIEAAVSRLFALQQNDLKSARRTKAVTQPRMLAMFLARRHTQAAYSEIGNYFGGRNHSTVIAAEKKVQAWLASDEELQIAGRAWLPGDLVETLEQQLLAG